MKRKVMSKRKKRNLLIATGTIMVISGGLLIYTLLPEKEEAPPAHDVGEYGLASESTGESEGEKKGKGKKGVVTEVPADQIKGKTEEKKELKKLDKNPDLEGAKELNENVRIYLEKKITEGIVLKTLMNETILPLNGTYVYGATVAETGEEVSLDLEIGKETVKESKLTVYDDFAGTKGTLKKGEIALTIIEYRKGKVANTEVIKVNNTLEEVQHAIHKVSFINKESFETAKEQEDIRNSSYEYLTVDDWKGMALLAGRDILDNEMAPIFVVPNEPLSQENGDFGGTFYYVIAGLLTENNSYNLTIKTHEGRNIKLDFGDRNAAPHIGKPVWIHVVTKDGKIESVITQSFPGANLVTMSQGVTKYIGSQTLEMMLEEEEDKKDDVH